MFRRIIRRALRICLALLLTLLLAVLWVWSMFAILYSNHHRINERSLRFADSADFSVRIRQTP